jgi:hypothetical protein
MTGKEGELPTGEDFPDLGVSDDRYVPGQSTGAAPGAGAQYVQIPEQNPGAMPQAGMTPGGETLEQFAAAPGAGMLQEEQITEKSTEAAPLESIVEGSERQPDMPQQIIQIDLGEGHPEDKRYINMGDVFDFEYSFVESETNPYPSLRINIKGIKLDYAFGEKNRDPEKNKIVKPVDERLGVLNIENDIVNHLRDKLTAEWAIGQAYLDLNSQTQSEVLGDAIKELPPSETVNKVKRLCIENILDKGSTKGNVKIPLQLKKTLGKDKSGKEHPDECHPEYINRVIEALPADKRTEVYGILAEIFFGKESLSGVAELFSGAKVLTGKIDSLEDFLKTRKDRLDNIKPNEMCQRTIDSMEKSGNDSVKKYLTKGLGYRVENIELNNVPYEAIRISKDFVSQLIEKKDIQKRETEKTTNTIGEYHYFGGIDEILTQRALERIDGLRRKINESNKKLYEEKKKVIKSTDEFVKDTNKAIYGLRNWMYEASKENEWFQKNKNKWPLKWYYGIFKGVEKRRNAMLDEGRKLDAKLITLEGTDAGIIETDDREKAFCLDRKVYDWYQAITECLPTAVMNEFFGQNKSVAEVFSEQTVMESKENGGAEAVHKFKKNMDYQISRLEKIFAFHQERKGFKYDCDEKPEPLLFYDTVEGRVLSDDEVPKNPFDYVVGYVVEPGKEEDKKTALLLCEDYSGRPVKKNEIPITVFTQVKEAPKKKTSERKEGHKLALAVGLLAALAAGGIITQGYHAIRNYQNLKSITITEGVSKVYEDAKGSVTSVVGEHENLTDKLKTSDSTIKQQSEQLARQDSTIRELKDNLLNKYLGLPNNPTYEEVFNRENDLLNNYTLKNKEILSYISTLTGTKPKIGQVCDAFVKTGNIQPLIDSGMYDGRMDSATIYGLYKKFMNTGQYEKAQNLNKAFGPIKIKKEAAKSNETDDTPEYPDGE